MYCYVLLYFSSLFTVTATFRLAVASAPAASTSVSSCQSGGIPQAEGNETSCSRRV